MTKCKLCQFEGDSLPEMGAHYRGVHPRHKGQARKKQRAIAREIVLGSRATNKHRLEPVDGSKSGSGSPATSSSGSVTETSKPNLTDAARLAQLEQENTQLRQQTTQQQGYPADSTPQPTSFVDVLSTITSKGMDLIGQYMKLKQQSKVGPSMAEVIGTKMINNFADRLSKGMGMAEGKRLSNLELGVAEAQKESRLSEGWEHEQPEVQ